MPTNRLVPRIDAGFTLIELAVATVVITVLATVLVASLGQAQATAMQLKCASNLQTINMGLVTYSNDYSGRLMPVIVQNLPAVYPSGTLNGWDMRYGGANGPGSGWVIWQYWLWPYVPNRKVFIDPAHAQWPDAAWQTIPPGSPPNYEPIGSLDGPFYWENYGANGMVLGGYPWSLSVTDPLNYPRLSQHGTPSQTMMVMDNGNFLAVAYDPMFAYASYYVPGCPGYLPFTDAYGYNNTGWVGYLGATTGPSSWLPGWYIGWPWAPQDFAGRHPRQAINALMIDGHVEPETPAYVESSGEMNYGWATPATPTVYFYGDPRYDPMALR